MATSALTGADPSVLQRRLQVKHVPTMEQCVAGDRSINVRRRTCILGGCHVDWPATSRRDSGLCLDTM